MGQSTNGILFYGIAYGEDLDLEEIASANSLDLDKWDDDFDKLYATKMGVLEPSQPFSRANEAAYVEYWSASRKVNDESGCEVGIYCSADYPMRYVCIKDGHYAVNRGYEIEIPNGLTAKPEWKGQLKVYCELMHLPYKEPRWWLVSYWG